jgi:Caspase domain
MTRVALVIANSVSSQPSLKAPRSQRVLRVAQQLKTLLTELPQGFAFETSYESDASPDRIEREARNAARKCRGSRGLLVVYYFGHARRDVDDLALVHPGKKRGERAYLPFKVLFHSVMSGNPHNVLFLLDCCYAGASQETFDLLPTSARTNCCVIASTSASTRAYWYGDDDSPIGFFTLALLDGLLLGTVSATDDAITADSLYKYAKSETKKYTDGAQEPYMFGSLSEQISRYSHNPVIVRGISQNVSEKSAYHKLIAILRTLDKRRYEDLQELYARILTRNRDAFLTNFIDEHHRIVQRPAQWQVLRRYVSFLRAIRAVDDTELRLTPRGEELLTGMDTLYNAKLQRLLVEYLGRERGLTVDLLRNTMQRVMERRWLPTRENVLNDLFLEKSYDLNEHHIGLVLDLLGCIGVIGTLRKRQQVYFPWNERPPRSKSSR